GSLGGGGADKDAVRQNLRFLAQRGERYLVQALVIACVQAAGLVPHDLHVLLRCRFSGVSRRRFLGDSRGEDATEVSHAQEQNQQQWQDEGELNEGLPPFGGTAGA